ncbi:glycosyltransferase family 4 protein [Ramlibacter sp. PS4R-6]|uniref:glycosyltransferase family 4 protein n=1 Tax=Ramlibacter sp. PS4R-6 TaxID=3133438 RepID=UPI003099B2FF
MKVAIATLGRFHVLDLARELDREGFDVAFHSYVPRRRAMRFGLPARCHRSLLRYVAPLVAAQRFAPRLFAAVQERAMARAVDAAVSATLAPCDVFVCMSGAYLRAARVAKERFGAQVWIERGSRHILSQKEILEELGAQPPTQFVIERELAAYELADRIVVPSRHVVESFTERAPHLAGKLFVNPYGVDLDAFPQTARPRHEGPCTVLFVGGWSKRKGVDLLVQAVRQLDGVRLLHVGSIVDVPFPAGDQRFVHRDAVPQWELAKHYAQADVFALASREEGLAMVQAQALASGLPLVCTERAGGGDLAFSPALAARTFVARAGNAAAFARGLEAAVRLVRDGLPPLVGGDREQLSWGAYGRRYAAELRRTAGDFRA